MKSTTQILLFGSLGKDHGGVRVHPLLTPTPFPELLRTLQIPFQRVQLVMVNHRAVPHDHVIHPGDRVSLFPREYAIFADWKNFRL